MHITSSVQTNTKGVSDYSYSVSLEPIRLV